MEHAGRYYKWWKRSVTGVHLVGAPDSDRQGVGQRDTARWWDGERLDFGVGCRSGCAFRDSRVDRCGASQIRLGSGRGRGDVDEARGRPPPLFS